MRSLQHFARLIEEASGNVVPDDQFSFLETLLEERAKHHPDVGSYLQALEAGELSEEWRSLLPRITVNESFLFRIPEQFTALERTILPELVRSGRDEIRVWSAACARGEEPATLAMVLSECRDLVGRAWTILGTDLDEEVLEVARAASFGQRATANVPRPLCSRWLVPDQNDLRLHDELRTRIEYRKLNLVTDDLDGLGGPFDIVFLRNVLIYFRAEIQRRVLQRIEGMLQPGGYLFLGHSESLWKLSDAFESIELEGCFAYRRRGAGRSLPPPIAPPARGQRARSEGAPSKTTRRPRKVVLKAAVPEDPLEDAIPKGASHADRDLRPAVAALRENRPEDALRLVQRRLEVAPEDAEAHALLGFLHDLAHRGDEATASYRAALFLEPAFFQIRLLLAVRLEDRGFRDRARTEYRSILSTLSRREGRAIEALTALSLPSPEVARQRAQRGLGRL